MAKQPDDPWADLAGEKLSLTEFKKSWATTPEWMKWLLGGLIVVAVLGFVF